MAHSTATLTPPTINIQHPCHLTYLEVSVAANRLPNLNNVPPAEGRVYQRSPLWLITNPNTCRAATWLIVAWERRGDYLTAAVVSENQDMKYLRTTPVYIQNNDVISTVPAQRTPQAPPIRWARDMYGEPWFQVITGWAWCNGLLKPITTTYDAPTLYRKGYGTPVWSCKDTDGEWLEGYPVGWRWENGQLVPECAVENAESLDMWDSLIKPTLKTLEV